MKSIKTLNILGLLILFTTLSMAQSRLDEKRPEFEKRSAKITKAMGWELSTKTGKWGSLPNKFENDIYQNFKSMQIVTMHYKGKPYWVLLVENVGGYYKYPKTRVDWTTYDRTEYFVLDEKGYKFMKSHVDGKWKQEMKLITPYFGEYINVNDGKNAEAVLMGKILSQLDANYVQGKKGRFQLLSQTLEGKDLVRFFLPHPADEINKFYFDNKYFEVSLSEFQKLYVEE